MLGASLLFLSKLPLEERQAPRSLEIVAFSDGVIPVEFAFLANYGIIGLYVSVVVVIGRFLRIMVDNISHRIIYEDMPQVSVLQHLCSVRMVAVVTRLLTCLMFATVMCLHFFLTL